MKDFILDILKEYFPFVLLDEHREAKVFGFGIDGFKAKYKV